MVAGALPTVGGAFTVTMNGFRPVPDERYRTMAEALVHDLSRESVTRTASRDHNSLAS
jgi:hypothetical protein